jgi:signal transduction histidine kinase
MSAKSVPNPFDESGKSHLSISKIVNAAKQEATGAKTSSYLLTTIITGLFYSSVTFLFIPLIPLELQLTAWLILSFLFAVTFSPIRYAMEEFIRQVFPGTDYDSHQLVKYLNTISYSSLTLTDLSTLFFDALAARFDVPESAFIFFPNKTTHLIKTSQHFQNLQAISAEDITLLNKQMIHESAPVKHFKNQALAHLTKSLHIRLLTPLTNNNELVGIMFLGSKYSLKPYTTKDIKVLNAIAPKIAFAIKNAFEYERVTKKNQELIKELRDTNQQLRLVNRKLKHDDKIKDEFVYVATHELKNPITAMKGYLSLIEEGQFGTIPEKLTNPINQIQASNQQLIELLNNLLQIARAEAQHLEIKTVPTVICDIIDSVAKDLKPLLDQKGLIFNHHCPNRAVTVMADKERLREIFSNLISNAIKYSNTGEIRISHDIEQGHLVTHVMDQGVGIAESDQTKLFTRFFRAEEEAAKGIPGTGLGLFICKQLIEKMKGKIWFKSELGLGSTFSFSLPIAHTYLLKSSR